jgi:hypothetical protein
MSNDTFTIYSIKYIETKGIIMHENCSYVESGYASKNTGHVYNSVFEKLGGTAFKTRTEAIEAGKKKLQKMLTALAKKSKKIERLISEVS